MHQQEEGSGGPGEWIEAGITGWQCDQICYPNSTAFPLSTTWPPRPMNQPAATSQRIQLLPKSPMAGHAYARYSHMVAALELYCDLLAEPGVLAAPFVHYARELRLVAAASRQLIEKIATLERRERVSGASSGLKRAHARGTNHGLLPRCLSGQPVLVLGARAG